MYRYNRGVALVTALFITAIATVAAVTLLSRQHIDIRRTGNVINSDQAYMYALGMESLAKEILIKVAKNTTGTPYDRAEMYAPQMFPVEGGSVSGKLVDMEKKFNVNNLIKDKKNSTGDLETDNIERRRFENILNKVIGDLQLSNVSSGDLVNAVADWIDPDSSTRFPGGAEDSEYMSADPPYRAANRMLASATELLLVQGFTRELLYGKIVDKEKVPGLLEYVTALPDNFTTININSIAPELLLTFSSKWTAADIESALSGRPFENVQDFTGKFSAIGQGDANVRKAFEEDISNLDVQSSYLMVDSAVTLGDNSFRLNSLIYRTTTADKIYTLSRAQGTEGI